MVRKLTAVAVAAMLAVTAVACDEDEATFQRQDQNSPVGLDGCERLAADFEAQTGYPHYSNDPLPDGSCNITRRDLQGDGK